MTDRELLELAAKAVRIEKDIFYSVIHDTCFLVSKYDSGSEYQKDAEWNPLTDDGDALRLAVNLGINVPTKWEVEKMERCGLDVYEATRRAIVRAAAEIGKGMK
jgi:hypothetical protein